MKTIKKIWDWIRLSSVDPDKTSLSVKSFGLGLIPIAIKLISVACLIGYCLAVQSAELEQLVNSVSNIVFWSLSVVASIGFIVGFGRKVFTTVAGTNAVLARE